MNANLRNFALWVIIVLLLLALFTLFQNPGQRTTSQDISFSQLLNEVDQGRVRDVLIQGPEIHGTFTDGREFDSSYKRGEPLEFGVTQVIKGWTEALQLMKVGAKWQLFIPSALAYGERGAGDLIGPNETLVFEVELLDVK